MQLLRYVRSYYALPYSTRTCLQKVCFESSYFLIYVVAFFQW